MRDFLVSFFFFFFKGTNVWVGCYYPEAAGRALPACIASHIAVFVFPLVLTGHAQRFTVTERYKHPLAAGNQIYQVARLGSFYVCFAASLVLHTTTRHVPPFAMSMPLGPAVVDLCGVDDGRSGAPPYVRAFVCTSASAVGYLAGAPPATVLVQVVAEVRGRFAPAAPPPPPPPSYVAWTLTGWSPHAPAGPPE